MDAVLRRKRVRQPRGAPGPDGDSEDSDQEDQPPASKLLCRWQRLVTRPALRGFFDSILETNDLLMETLTYGRDAESSSRTRRSVVVEPDNAPRNVAEEQTGRVLEVQLLPETMSNNRMDVQNDRNQLPPGYFLDDVVTYPAMNPNMGPFPQQPPMSMQQLSSMQQNMMMQPASMQRYPMQQPQNMYPSNIDFGDGRRPPAFSQQIPGPPPNYQRTSIYSQPPMQNMPQQFSSNVSNNMMPPNNAQSQGMMNGPSMQMNGQQIMRMPQYYSGPPGPPPQGSGPGPSGGQRMQGTAFSQGGIPQGPEPQRVQPQPPQQQQMSVQQRQHGGVPPPQNRALLPPQQLQGQLQQHQQSRPPAVVQIGAVGPSAPNNSNNSQEMEVGRDLVAVGSDQLRSEQDINDMRAELEYLRDRIGRVQITRDNGDDPEEIEVPDFTRRGTSGQRKVLLLTRGLRTAIDNLYREANQHIRIAFKKDRTLVDQGIYGYPIYLGSTNMLPKMNMVDREGMYREYLWTKYLQAFGLTNYEVQHIAIDGLRESTEGLELGEKLGDRWCTLPVLTSPRAFIDEDLDEEETPVVANNGGEQAVEGEGSTAAPSQGDAGATEFTLETVGRPRMEDIIDVEKIQREHAAQLLVSPPIAEDVAERERNLLSRLRFLDLELYKVDELDLEACARLKVLNLRSQYEQAVARTRTTNQTASSEQRIQETAAIKIADGLEEMNLRFHREEAFRKVRQLEWEIWKVVGLLSSTKPPEVEYYELVCGSRERLGGPKPATRFKRKDLPSSIRLMLARFMGIVKTYPLEEFLGGYIMEQPLAILRAAFRRTLGPVICDLTDLEMDCLLRSNIIVMNPTLCTGPKLQPPGFNFCCSILRRVTRDIISHHHQRGQDGANLLDMCNFASTRLKQRIDNIMAQFPGATLFLPPLPHIHVQPQQPQQSPQQARLHSSPQHPHVHSQQAHIQLQQPPQQVQLQPSHQHPRVYPQQSRVHPQHLNGYPQQSHVLQQPPHHVQLQSAPQRPYVHPQQSCVQLQQPSQQAQLQRPPQNPQMHPRQSHGQLQQSPQQVQLHPSPQHPHVHPQQSRVQLQQTPQQTQLQRLPQHPQMQLQESPQQAHVQLQQPPQQVQLHQSPQQPQVQAQQPPPQSQLQNPSQQPLAPQLSQNEQVQESEEQAGQTGPAQQQETSELGATSTSSSREQFPEGYMRVNGVLKKVEGHRPSAENDPAPSESRRVEEAPSSPSSSSSSSTEALGPSPVRRGTKQSATKRKTAARSKSKRSTDE